MSGDLSANNPLLNGYNNTIMSDDWLLSGIGKDINAQKSQLNTLFTQMSDNDVSSADKKKLEDRKAALEEKILTLQKKMEDIGKEIQDKQDAIDAMAKQIANLALDANNESEKLAQDTQKWVSECISDFFRDCGKTDKTTGKPLIAEGDRQRVLQNRLAECPDKSYKVQGIIDNLKSKESEVTPMVNQIENWNSELGNIEVQYGALAAAKNVIGRNLAQIGKTETSYTNSDYDNKAPIYSLDKLDIVSNLLADPSINVGATNSNYDANSSKPTLDGIKDKYGSLYSPSVQTPEGKDQWSTDNQSIVNLGKAVEQGLLTDLLQAGLSKDEIGKFLTENFAGAKISYNDQGVLQIPKGHAATGEANHASSKAREIFTGITDFFNNPTYVGSKDTWSESGNTIDSNAQLKALSENYEDIFKQLQDKGFTFKEAMYALFDKNVGIFKDSGINFNLNDLGKDTEPSYSIDLAGDDKTAKMYEGIAAKIKDVWGVSASRSAGAEQVDADSTVDNTQIDPISFRKGDTEYAFTFDRDGDGVFDGINEFAGADSGSNWFEDLSKLDTDGNGVLDGDELKNVMLLGTKYDDNAETEKNKEGYLRSETTNVNYTMSSAASLGIKSIDLTAYKNGEKQVGDNTGKTDVNGSAIFNDGFNIEFTDGSTVEASRKDDTSTFMNAVYGDAAGKSYKIGLSEADSQDEINKAYAEFDAKKEEYGIDDKILVEDYAILKGYGDTVKEVEDNFKKGVKKAQNTKDLLANRAYNKINAMPNFDAWDDVKDEAEKVLKDKGYEFTSDAQEQLKGICNSKNITSANSLVQAYLDQLVKEKENGLEP